MRWPGATGADALSLAIAKACGVPNTDDIQAITYSHHVGEMPTLSVQYVCLPTWESFTLDAMELRTITVQFSPKVNP